MRKQVQNIRTKVSFFTNDQWKIDRDSNYAIRIFIDFCIRSRLISIVDKGYRGFTIEKIANLDDEYDVDFVDFGIMTKQRLEGKRE